MSELQDSDEWLMREVATGRRECLAQLVRRYASPLLTFIHRMVGDLPRSEDLFQEVFLAVWTKRTQYQFPRKFQSWLFAIASNQCRLDYRRGRRPVLQFDDEMPVAPVSSEPPPDESVLVAETATLIAVAVARLPTQQRTVVVLRVWNEMSYAQIAEIVECSEATVRSHMHHALTALRKFLEPRLGDG